MEAGITRGWGAFFAREHENGLPLDEADLERAFEVGEFVMDYQPIVSIRSGAVTGADATIRWDHPDWGLLPQRVVYAVADRLGASPRIAGHAVGEACRQLARWKQEGAGVSALSMRLSGAQLGAESVFEQLAQSIAEFDISSSQLTFEVPEMSTPEESPRLLDRLKRLRQKGYGIVLGDFGAHHTAMSTLMVLPVTGVKFGEAFTERLPGSPTAEAILSSVSRLAHDLGLTLTVSGVENGRQFELLRRYRDIELQGAYLFKPMRAEVWRECVNPKALLQLNLRESPF